MPTPHVAEVLANLIDGVLLVAAGLALLRRRSLLALVVLLLAADPFWTLAANALLSLLGAGRGTAGQAVSVVLADAPLWTAFVLGLLRVFRAEPAVRGPSPGVARQ